MEEMDNYIRHELVRKELAKKYTHVTFVRNLDEGESFERAVWYVNDEMQEITVMKRWEVNEILFHLEMKKLKNVDIYSAKYATFEHLMKIGKIELDHTLYKKTTLKKLEELM